MKIPSFPFVTALLVVAGSACGSTLGNPPPVTLVSETTGKNPFKDVNFFLNPDYTANVEATAKRHPEMADHIRKVAAVPDGGLARRTSTRSRTSRAGSTRPRSSRTRAASRP